MRRTAPLLMPVDAALAEALEPASWREVTPVEVAAEERRGAAGDLSRAGGGGS